MDDLRELLGKYKVDLYFDLFEKNEIDIDVLPDIEEKDLQELGIPLGDRKRILRLIEDLRRQPDKAGDGSDEKSLVEEKRDQQSKPKQSEIRQVSVLFADLVGSTQLAERLDIEDNHDLLIQFQQKCGEIIRESGGYPIREAGDGLLACFGFPRATELDADHAARAALRIISTISQMTSEDQSKLSVRVGIATGMALTVDLLAEQQPTMSPATGAIFNLAARIQTLADPGTVFIDDETRRLLGERYLCNDLGPKTLKGFSQAKRVWQLVSVKQRLALPREIEAQALTPMIGRREEIEFLRLRWHAAERKSHVALVTGEPGIGKSRLVKQLLKDVAPLSRDIIWMQCSSDDTLRPFHPIIEGIEDISGLVDTVDPAERQQKFKTWLEEVQHFAPMAAEAFNHLLSAGLNLSSTLQSENPNKVKVRIFEALLELFKKLASQSPILIVVEDIHWIDPSTEEFLDFLYHHIEEFRVLLVCTYRPDYRPSFIGEPSVSLISLTRLGDGQSNKIIDSVIGSEQLPQGIANEILSKTDGVPLFIEELTKAALEEKSTSSSKEPERQTSKRSMQLPTTLRGSLIARLDRIPGAQKILPAGAAIGRTFSHSVLLEVCGASDAEVGQVASGLISAGLLTRSGRDAETAYRFKHALVQDAAYQTLTKKRRADLHSKIADALVDRAEGARDVRPETLARHFFQAGANAKACQYWREAAVLAQRSSAGKEAVSYLKAALDANREMAEGRARTDLEIELREALYVPLQVTNWGSSEIASNMERLRELRISRGDAEELLDILHAQSGYQLICGGVSKARALGQEILDRYGADRDARFLALRCLGFSSFLAGEFDQAIAELEEMIALDSEVDHERIKKFYQADSVTIAQAMICWAQAWKGEVDAVSHCSGEIRSRVLDSEDRWTSVYALTILASAYQTIGDGKGCREFLELATPIAEEIESDYWIGWGLVLSGWVTALQDCADSGNQELVEGIRKYESTGSSQMLPYARVLLAEALMADARDDEAQEVLRDLAADREPPEIRYIDEMVERLRQKLVLRLRTQGLGDPAGFRTEQ